MRSKMWLAVFGLVQALAASADAQSAYGAPRHVSDFPNLATGRDPAQAQASLELGPQLERGRSAAWTLAEHRRIDKALAGLQPQRKGVIDAYVVSVALDSDPVFGREAREAARVLARRYDAAGRSITLAGPDGSGPSPLPGGSIESLTVALARVAELMDRQEDVLVLYATSHGVPAGIVYHDGDEGFGLIAPSRLAAVLGELGIRNRLLILSACYSGVFVPPLASATSVLITAAAHDRSSFGCQADNDWTFFGDALVNRALRKPQPLVAGANEASAMIWQWEIERALSPPSNPQVSMGDGVGAWLGPLEARMPKTATAPVGRPAAAAPSEPAGR